MKVTPRSSWPFWLSYFVIVEIFGPAKYGLVSASFKSTIACENKMMHLSCPHKSLVLKVFSAKYGRVLSRRNICQSDDPSHVIKDCGEDNVTPTVQKLCKVKTECSFTVSNKKLGQYCTNVYKYLVVVYGCVEKPKTPTPLTTTQATTTHRPTTQTTTTFMNITTSANSTMENSTSVTKTTPRSNPVEFGWRNRRFTNRPNKPSIETYDRDVFRRNHGTSSRYVSGLRSVGISLLVLLLFEVYI